MQRPFGPSTHERQVQSKELYMQLELLQDQPFMKQADVAHPNGFAPHVHSCTMQ
jgi:hypothetical protein